MKRGSKIHRLDIEHAPWPLRNGLAEVSVNTMAQAAGLPLPGQKPHVLICRQLQVVAHWPRPA